MQNHELINLSNVTLISVSCVRVQETIEAIKKSMEGIIFGKCKLITNEDINDDKIEIYKIEKLDYEGYNKFIVYNLYKYIDTDYALIIQDDGYVIIGTKINDYS